MRLKLTYILLIISFVAYVYGQERAAYIQNYTIPNYLKQPEVYSIFSNADGILFFNTEAGIIKYNGVEWETLNTNENVNLLYLDTLFINKIYFSSDRGIYYLEKDVKHEYIENQVLEFKDEDVQLLSIFRAGNRVMCLSANSLYVVNGNNGTFSIKLKLPSELLYGFNFDNDLYIFATDNNLYKLVNNNFEKLIGHTFTKENNLLFDFPFSKGKVMFGSTENKLYLFNGETISSYKTNDYIKNNSLIGGINYSDTHYAISTISGGAILINKATNIVEQTMNFQNGLPDDEITAIYKTKQGGMWIGHGLGISRSDITIPVRNMGVFPGLIGEPTALSVSNMVLYVGTNEGVFYLTKVLNMDEVNHYIKKEHSRSVSFETYTAIRNVKKKIRFTVFKDKEQKDTAELKEVEVNIKVPVDSVVSNVKDVFKDNLVRENYALTSIPFVFKRVKGINARCNTLTACFDEAVLAGTSAGLFYVNNLESKAIIKNEEINVVYNNLSDNLIYVGTNKALYKISIIVSDINILDKLEVKTPVLSIAGDGNKIYFTQGNVLYQLISEANSLRKNIIQEFDEEVLINSSFNQLYLTMGGEVSTFYPESVLFEKVYQLKNDIYSANSIISAQSNLYWINTLEGWKLASTNDTLVSDYIKLFNSVQSLYKDNYNLWGLFDGGIYKINLLSKDSSDYNYKLYIDKILDEKGKHLPVDRIELKYNTSYVEFHLAALYYLNENANLYQYKLIGGGKDWSEWNTETVVKFDYLPGKRYVFQARSKNILGKISESDLVELIIHPPFYKTWWFYTIIGAILLVILRIYTIYRTKMLEKENRILQEKINAATAEITKQKDELEVAYKDIEVKNKHITDSINYAEKIQAGILPNINNIKKVINQIFVVYIPRDIVSGDFFWFRDFDDYCVLIAADCTGHGVPGGFMSMIGNTLLNQIVHHDKISDPAEICYKLDYEVVKVLKQDTANVSLDGMDISICTYFKKKKEMHYAGAMNPLVYFENDSLVEVQGDQYPIGGVYQVEKEFKKHIVKIKQETMFYIFSDGFYDQFGGPLEKRQKFMVRRFKSLLDGLHTAELEVQEEMLNNELEFWKGDRKQTDDILIIGFKLKP